MTEEKTIACRVRSGLVCALKENLIHEAGTKLNLTAEQYKRHQVQLELEEQYQAREKAKKTKA